MEQKNKLVLKEFKRIDFLLQLENYTENALKIIVLQPPTAIEIRRD